MRTPPRWTMRAIVVLAAVMVEAGCAITHGVTGKFPTEVNQPWCVTRDVFVVRTDSRAGAWLAGVPALAAMPAGAAHLPKSSTDFDAHPSDWYRQPGYPFDPKPADVRAAFPRGSRFHIVKITKVAGPWYDQGWSLRPEIVFDTPGKALGRINATELLVRRYDADHLRFGVAASCP